MACGWRIWATLVSGLAVLSAAQSPNEESEAATLPYIAIDFGFTASYLAVWKDGDTHVVKNGEQDHWAAAPWQPLGVDGAVTHPLKNKSAMAGLCGALRDAAESYLGLDVEGAVITYPECSSLGRPVLVERQVRRTVAAALAYDLEDTAVDEFFLVVVDTDNGLAVSINAVEEGIFDRVGYRHAPSAHAADIARLLDEAIAGSEMTELQDRPLQRSDIRHVVHIGPQVTDKLRTLTSTYFGRALEEHRPPSAELAPVYGAMKQLKRLFAPPDILGRTCPCGGHGHDEL